MEKIIIRKATREDLVSIQELNNSLFELEYENFDNTLKKGWPFEKEGKEYFEYMINDEVVFVAQDKEKTVGYLAGSICAQISYVTETFAELDNMCIDDNYRRFGIGTAMASKLILMCLEKGIYPSWDAANLTSLELAKKLGYNYDSEYTIYIINE